MVMEVAPKSLARNMRSVVVPSTIRLYARGADAGEELAVLSVAPTATILFAMIATTTLVRVGLVVAPIDLTALHCNETKRNEVK